MNTIHKDVTDLVNIYKQFSDESPYKELLRPAVEKALEDTGGCKLCLETVMTANCNNARCQD